MSSNSLDRRAKHVPMTSTDWPGITRRIGRSVQTTIGWIFWDPAAIGRYEALGVPQAVGGPIGYVASRAAPLAGAGPDAVVAAFGSISPAAIRGAFQVLGGGERFIDVWHARNEAVIEGLQLHAPDTGQILEEFGQELWEVVERLPSVGRVLFASHLTMPRPHDAVLSGWHAINCLREWRGDTHWALVVAAGLDHAEASILHNAWLGYEPDWLAKSRGTSSEAIVAGWQSLRERGFADGVAVLPSGIALRQQLEDDTDRLTSTPWDLLGLTRTVELTRRLEPPCELLLRRVDETAGVAYQPASRIRS